MKTGFTDPYVKNLTKPGRYTDATTHGLNLNIKNNGRKYWVFRYLYTEKRSDLAFGVYPYVNAPEAHLYLAKQMWEEANHCVAFVAHNGNHRFKENADSFGRKVGSR